MKPPLFAVDTNFLMNLSAASDTALDALDVIRKRAPKAAVLATESVLNELVHFTATPSSGKQPLARKALVSLLAWGIQPTHITDLQATFADSIAGKLIDQGIIPADENNDATILAEAAVLECQILVSSDSDLRDANRSRLALALQACGVSVVVVCTPNEIVRMFAGR